MLRVAEGHAELAVIKPAGRNVMALPKGHIERGETSQQAAEREIREETGLDVICLQKLTDVKYIYRFKGKTVFKCVSFYLFQYASGEIDAISESMRLEVDVARWVSLEVAAEKLSYPGERDLVAKVLAEFQK